MKIAFDAKRFFHNASGLGNYSRDLIRMLSSYFPDHQYLLFAKSKSKRGQEILELPNVEFHEISSGKWARQRKMGVDAQNAGADIFHGLSGELPWSWNAEPIKKVVTIHDLIFERFPQYYSFFDRKIHLWKFKKACHQADLVIAISEQTKRDIIQFLHIPEEKIKVIYQGCHQSFKEQPTEEFLFFVKDKFSLPHRFILNVGTIEVRKNLQNVIKALKGTAIPLVVVGKKTKYQKVILKEIERCGVEVHFLEGVSMAELAAIYHLADMMVYPSFFEGFGIPVIEALFTKTAVITSNTSSLPEAGGPDSLYIDPKNSNDLRAKILFLWDNEAERKRRAEKGFQFVQKFSDEGIATELMQAYLSLFPDHSA